MNSISQQVAELRAKFVSRMGDIKRAVEILLNAGFQFALAVRMCLSFKKRVVV